MYNNDLFKAGSKRMLVEQAMPWAITFEKETIKNVDALRRIFGILLKKLLVPFCYNGYEITFKLKKSKADNSNLAKEWGNSVGGHLKCCFCSADWSSDWIICYAYSCCQLNKNLKTIVQAVKNNTGSNYGISFLPGILLDDMNADLTKLGLDEYEKGHDRLHNSKGHMAKMYELFKDELEFDEKESLANLQKFVHRHSFKTDMKGSDWRYFFVLYEKTLLPCIKKDKEEARFIIKTWLEIQFICYQGN
jgi:hypothetical protein